MRIKFSGSVILFKGLLLSALLVLMMAPSCTNSRNKTDHGKLIPEKKFVSILADIYVANGLLSLPEVRYKYNGRDSVLNYIDIIESYGYSYETMNNTMNYYFVSKPKKLIKLYDNVIRQLNEEQSAIQNEINKAEEGASRMAVNYNVFTLPDPERSGALTVNNILNPPGSYNLIFSVTVYPDDKSFNPHFTAYLIDADSTETGKKRWLPRVEYFKYGHLHQFNYMGRVETDRPAVMKIIFYNYENDISEWDKHARIEMISFSFIVDPL
ncbi:MAG: DUF4296 domain-containing protein [Bacteroidales bacterium]|nr:DUF4296 domain-containing protein [Bacteroidales bacterium]